MSPEAQRIAIAEACGWHVHGKPTPLLWLGNSPETLKAYVPDLNMGPQVDRVPDYLNDLNAMNEVEKTLMADDAKYSQRNFYAAHLGSITLNDNARGWEPLSNDDCFPILHATAAQRAEAFLRTIGKWTDTPNPATR